VAVRVRQLEPADRDWVKTFVAERWGGSTAVGRGRVWHPAELPGLVAEADGRPVGLLTYEVDGEACEIVTIDSVVEGEGVGTALVEAVADAARAGGCSHLRLITTNDNLRALRFYQRRGFHLTALRPGGVDDARRLKPQISFVGQHGIPLRDELELERPL
jgi:ribosomal protein S18 acetylase RimI-like enzyme